MSQNSMFIYSWYVDEKETEFTKIRIYGIDKDNKNICLHVNDFTPYVYLELPTYTEWNERKAQLLGNKIDEELGEFAPLRKSLIMKYKLYGAHFDKNGKRKKFPYLFCSFAHKSHIDKKLSSLLRRSLVVQGIGHVRMKVHESSADPVLQLICCRDIPSIGWIKFVGEELTDDSKYTLCDKEYNVKWKGIFNADENTVGLPLIMGFDIEVNSTNPTVMPKAKNPGDKVFQISCIFNREGRTDCESYLLTLAEADQQTVGENIKIISCKTEAELLISFTELVRNKKPNIITGYNILGFDIQYMIDRAKFNLCISKFDQIGFHLYNHSKEKTIKWSSSAYKNQEFSYLDAEGIIFVDLLPLIRRDFKFSSYNLKTVSKEILKDDTKVDLSIPRMFKLYKIGVQKLKDGTYSKRSKKAMGIIGKYCFKDSDLCVKLMQKMQTWIGLTEMAKTCNVGIFSLYSQGQQIKVYSQVYRYCLKNNFVVEKDGYVTKEGERYAGAHVFPPIPGLYERVLPFDFCFSGDTLVTMANGLSKKIKDIENENLVIGFDELNSGYKEFLSINGLQNKGIKNTVKLLLQDGRNIICTPEHKFMSDENEWIEAKNLKNKWIKCGIEYPEDIICKKEQEWCLKVEGYEFNMKNNVEREKSLAFARMLGYIFSDGSIYTTDIEEFYCKFCNIIISSKNNAERHFNSLRCIQNKKKYEENENIHYEKNRIKNNTKPDKRFKENKNENRPKNKMTLYLIFSKFEHAIIKKEMPNINNKDIFKEIGNRWQKIKNNKEKLDYYKQFITKDEIRYEKEMLDYKKSKYSISPKKNMYIIFCLEERKNIKNNPNLLVKYEKLAEKDKLRYENEINQNNKNIKKPKNIFWIFYEKQKDNLYKKNPELSGKEIVELARNLWKDVKNDSVLFETYKKLEEEDIIRYNKEIGTYEDNIIFENNVKIIKRKVVEASFGTIIDAQNFMRDIKRFIEYDISIIKKNGNNNTKRGIKGTTYNITLPVSISKMIHSLDDIVVGKRAIQGMKLPKFIKDENCPDSILKEFLSGLYGGDGHTISLSNNKFSKVAFSWYTIENEIDGMKNVFNELKMLHDRIGIKCKIYDPVLVKYKNNIMIPQDIESNPRYMFKLCIENLNVFYKNISFKYCINKQYKFVIANSYYEYKKISKKTTINNYLKQTKTENWFKKKSYSVKQDDLYIPEYRQKIIDIIENGEENVYDIEVEHAHNFLANGAVAHNCSLYPTT